jgi:hypothetical protein
MRVGAAERYAARLVKKQAAEIERLKGECKELHERAAAAESKEVCTKPHSDEVLTFCPYCNIEALQQRVRELEESRTTSVETTSREQG